MAGNVIHTMGEAVIHCHGVQLKPAEPEEADEKHNIKIEQIEDELYVHIDHDMTKQHYISFIAAASSDRMQIVKLYPISPVCLTRVISLSSVIFLYKIFVNTPDVLLSLPCESLCLSKNK